MTSARSLMIWIGGAALIAATAIDTLAVIGRQIGMPLRGSIELVQAAVLVAGSIALIAATLGDRHARVRLVVDRLGDRLKPAFDKSSDLLTAMFLIAILAGSAWLAVELWPGHEISEVVGVQWQWLRLFANVSLAIAAAIALRRLFGGARP